MKTFIYLLTGLTLFFCAACGQERIKKTVDHEVTQLETFKLKEKFTKDDRLHYPGIGDPKIKPMLTGKINQSADDFKALLAGGATTDKAYQDALKKGLDRFAEVYISLDTEDRERVCHYYEELMDIVGLESSDGHLNDFMYGFDPTN